MRSFSLHFLLFLNSKCCVVRSVSCCQYLYLRDLNLAPDECRLPVGSTFGVAPRPLVGEELQKSRDLDCYGKEHAWTTWPSEAPPERCPAGSKGDRTCTPFERSKDLFGMMFNGCAISHTFNHADRGADFPALDMTDGGTGSDTWYPYWGADGRWCLLWGI